MLKIFDSMENLWILYNQIIFRLFLPSFWIENWLKISEKSIGFWEIKFSKFEVRIEKIQILASEHHRKKIESPKSVIYGHPIQQIHNISTLIIVHP
jgi:hypothetical protein